MTTAERMAILRALEVHPEIKRRYPQFWRVKRLEGDALRQLAKSLGLDVAGLQRPNRRGSVTAVPQAQPEAPFKGTFGFTLNIEAFGINTPRRARVVWEYTPEWPYFPPKGRMRIDGQEDCSFTVEVETVTLEDGESGPLTLYDWQPLVLWGAGFVGEDVVERIFERIDEHARAQNRARRARRNRGER